MTLIGAPRFLSSSHSAIVLTVVCCIGAWLTPIYAENFGITLDNTCKTMIRNNISSNCPTYEDIITLFPDTSIQDVSGKFSYYNGFYQRGPTKFTDSFEYYRFGDRPILFVDPPVETANRIKLIEIKANLDEYLLRGITKSYDAANHTLTLGHGRYVDSCRLAYVDSSQWAYLVGDSIHYMSKGCSEDSTTFDSKRIIQLYKIKHDITTSYKYKLEQWQKEMINKCGSKICLYVRNQTSPP